MALSMGSGQMSEFEGAGATEEDFSVIPLLERVEHKNFKARISAYTELSSKFSKTGSDDDPIFRPYLNGDLLKRWVMDSHAMAQEKGVEAVLALTQYSGESSARTRQEVLPEIVTKCFGATRGGTKTKGIEVALMYVEVENGGEGVVMDVLKGLDAKAPKAVVGAVQCLKDVVAAFGTKTLGNTKPMLASLPKMFDHKDKAVRAEATLLCQALYRYMGSTLVPLLSDLKEVQLKELQSKFDEMDSAGEGGKCKATRLTRKAQRMMESEAASSGPGGGGAAVEEEEAEAVDPLSLIESVNVVPRLPSNFMEDIVAAKWSVKVDVAKLMEAEVQRCPKIQNVPELGPYVDALALKLKESHAAVIAAAVAVLTELAKRIEDKGFGKYKAAVLPAAMGKFTEKRAIPILAQLLDDTFACCELSDVIEDCAAQTKSKVAAVKENTVAFLVRCLCSTKSAPRKDDIKPIVDILLVALGDAGAPIRQHAINGLAALQKIVGERMVDSYTADIQDIQKKLVSEAAGKIEVKYKPGAAVAKSAFAPPRSGPSKPAPARSMPPATMTAPLKSKPPPSKPRMDEIPVNGNDDDGMDEPYKPAQYKDFMDDPNAFAPEGEMSKPRAAPPARFAPKMASKPPVSKPPMTARPAPTAKSAAPGKPAAAPTVSGPEPVTYQYSSEAALAMAEELIPEEIKALIQLPSSQWKDKVQGLSDMIDWVKDGAGKDADAEVLVRFFEKPLNGGEKLIQVITKIFELLISVAEFCPSFGKPAAALSIGPLIDKFGDIKGKKLAGDALTLYSEKISLGFVLSQALDPMVKLKTPKGQTEALGWVRQALLDFGLVGVPVKDLINYFKIGLGNTQAPVRAAAIQALVVVKMTMGSDILSLLEDQNAQLLGTITAEFTKVDGQTPPAPTRKSAVSATTSAAGGKGKGGASADPLDQLVPRVDLDKLVASTSFLADSKSDSFKERKAGADALLAVLEIKSNGRLKPNMGETGTALKGRLTDSNLGVRLACLQIISKIATGMGSGFSQHAKLLTGPISNILCDQKAMVRNAALETLTHMRQACDGLDTLIPSLATTMEQPNSVARALVGNFMLDAFKTKQPPSNVDLGVLVDPIFASLEDKIADARKAATLLLPFVIANVGYNAIVERASSLKPASRTTVTNALQAAKAAGLPISRSVDKVAPPAATSSTKVPTTKSSETGAPPRSVAPAAPAAVRAGSMATKANALRPPSGSLGDGDDMPKAAASLKPLYRSKLTMKAPAASQFTSSSGKISSTSAQVAASDDKSPPFITMDADAKVARSKRDVTRWSLETHSAQQLIEYLQRQAEGHVTAELASQLFSVDRMAEKDHLAALVVLEDFYSQDTSLYGLPVDSMRSLRLSNSDLAVKYAALRMHEGSTQMILKCLDVLANIVHVVDDAEGGGFSDTETHVLLPALISRLGDKKFADRLASIFSMIDRAIPASKVLQYYVDYGVGSSNAKTRATATENLAQLIRRRGDVAASSSAGPKLYKRIAAQIASPDPATRSAALDCMAYLYKHSGDSMLHIVSDLKPKEQDLLSNRIEKMAAAPATKAIPSGTALRTPKRISMHQSTPSRLASARASPSSSPSPEAAARAAGGIPRPISSSSTKHSRSPPENEAPSSQPSRIPSRLSRPPHNTVDDDGEGFAAEYAPSGSSLSSNKTSAIINCVTSTDADESVEALKRLQRLMETTPDVMTGNREHLVSVITMQLREILSRRFGLQDPKYFRLLKHLVQTLSNFCDIDSMAQGLSVNAMRGLLEQLTLGLMETDTAASQDVKDMSRFLNMTILRLFGTGRRATVFESLFGLLQQITADFDSMTQESTLEFRHAELVLKCIWKRARSAEEDLAKGSLNPRDLLRIIENFMRAIPPKEWRLRATQKVPLGDMPLRTIKVLIQHIITQCGPTRAIEALQEAFGDRAVDTTVYEYLYRIINMQSGNAEAGPSKPSSRPATPTNNDRSSDKTESPPAMPAPPTETAPASLIEDDLDAKLEPLVKNASSANGASGDALPKLYDFLRAHPEKRDKYERMLDRNLGPDSRYKIFIKRKLDRLESENQPEPKSSPSEKTRAEQSRPTAPLALANNLRQTNRVSSSGAPPPSWIPADADDETRLALLKDKFQFFAQNGGEA